MCHAPGVVCGRGCPEELDRVGAAKRDRVGAVMLAPREQRLRGRAMHGILQRVALVRRVHSLRVVREFFGGVLKPPFNHQARANVDKKPISLKYMSIVKKIIFLLNTLKILKIKKKLNI